MERIKHYGYDNEHPIGRGSTGCVYQARDYLEDRDVALKILHASLNSDPNVRERFIREAQIACTLRHPNIAEVYEFDVSENLPYFAMELLSGATLRAYKQHVTLTEKVELIAQVCDGLAAAHQASVIHRDVKPSNIFIHEDGGGDKRRIAKLLDFGIARIPDSTLTRPGSILGTLKYMAPEQIEKEVCDARSDIFSLSIVLFEFLVRTHPFQGAQITNRILKDEPDRLRSLDPLIPAQLEELVYLGLNKDPEKRFQTAQEFAHQLRSFLRGLELGRAHPIRAPQPVPSEERPGDTEQSVSPEGKMKRLIGLVQQFDREVKARDAEAAQRTFARIRVLSEGQPALAAGVRQCESELVLILPTPLAKAPSAVQDGPAAMTVEGSPSTEAISSQGSPFPSWDDTGCFSGPSNPSDLAVEPHGGNSVPEVRKLVCPSCGVANRDAASFCAECGAALVSPGVLSQDQTSQPPHNGTEMPQQSTGSIAHKRHRLNWSTLKRRVGTIAVPLRVVRWFEDRVTHVPILQTLGLAALSIVVIGLLGWIAVILFKPIPIEKPFCTAVVQVTHTDLLAEPHANSKRLMPLPKGTGLNVLDRVSPNQPFVRVQFVSAQKNSAPGYVRLKDLENWSDPEVAWQLLGFNRPVDAADPQQWHRFADQLREFGLHYPNSPQADKSRIEQVNIYISQAEKKKTAGNPEQEWKEELDNAKQALSDARQPNSTEAIALAQKISALDTHEVKEQLVTERDLIRNRLQTKAYGLYTAGDFNGLAEVANQMDSVDKARANELRAWVRQAQQMLHPQK